MFLGHFAVGMAAKTIAPRASLAVLIAAAQFIDLLWPFFLLLGIESVRVDPGNTAVVPLDFEHYPWSHSLLAVAGWAVLVGGVSYGLWREAKVSVLLGVLVLSHWLLDFVVHRPDLPLWPGGPRVGLELWRSLPVTLLVELSLLFVGAWLYQRTTQARDVIGRWAYWLLIAALLFIYAGSVMGPPPPGISAIAWTGQAQWLLVAWAYWADRHRSIRMR